VLRTLCIWECFSLFCFNFLLFVSLSLCARAPTKALLAYSSVRTSVMGTGPKWSVFGPGYDGNAKVGITGKRERLTNQEKRGTTEARPCSEFLRLLSLLLAKTNLSVWRRTPNTESYHPAHSPLATLTLRFGSWRYRNRTMDPGSPQLVKAAPRSEEAPLLRPCVAQKSKEKEKTLLKDCNAGVVKRTAARKTATETEHFFRIGPSLCLHSRSGWKPVQVYARTTHDGSAPGWATPLP
jgi:hypothetical protein